MRRVHKESHLVKRIGWLRAAVLGANDGIISTASLILGVAAAVASKSDILLAGVAGLAAGAMSMAAGEYVSVSSQSDTEMADLAREKPELLSFASPSGALSQWRLLQASGPLLVLSFDATGYDRFGSLAAIRSMQGYVRKQAQMSA